MSQDLVAAISLIIPQPKISPRYQPTTQDARVSIETLFSLSQDKLNCTAKSLIESLAQDTHSHVLMITSNATATTPATVMGAYLPKKLSNEQRGFQSSTSYLLFQLRPHFLILRWNSPHIPLTSIIEAGGGTSTSTAVVTSDEVPVESTTSYRIGHPQSQGASLCIDLEKKSALLTSSTMDVNPEEVVEFKPLCKCNHKDDMVISGHREVAVDIDHFEILRVIGTLNTPETACNQNRYVQDPDVKKITGEELSKRIEGFGSSSF